MPHEEMKVRRKSLHRSTNAKRAKKFANMRAAKERKRLERLAEPTPALCPMCEAHGAGPCSVCDRAASYQPAPIKPLFVITIRCTRDGVSAKLLIHHTSRGLRPSATMAGRKIATLLANYWPAP